MRPALLPALVASIFCATVFAPSHAAEMSFTTIGYSSDPGCSNDCPRLMQASGAITTKTPQEFLKFARAEIDRPGLLNVLLIHSPGGSVKASLELGRSLRKLGTIVIVARAMDRRQLDGAAGRAQKGLSSSMRFVSGTCASACVYALAGGYKRVVPPESRIAVHRMAGNVSNYDFVAGAYENTRVYAGASELETLSQYIKTMGVNTDLVGMAESVPHDQARVLSTKEMSRLRLASPRL